MKNENHEKLIFFEDFGQFGRAHPTPEVKICLYTKFEANQRELEKLPKKVMKANVPVRER